MVNAPPKNKRVGATYRNASDPAGSASGSGTSPLCESKQSGTPHASAGNAHSATMMLAPPSKSAGSSASGSSTPTLEAWLMACTDETETAALCVGTCVCARRVQQRRARRR